MTDTSVTKSSKHSRRRNLLILILAAIVLLAAAGTLGYITFSNREEHYPPASNPALGLNVNGAPKEMTIGVLYSLTDDPAVETSLVSAADGAEVAAYRFGLGGTDIRFATANDGGTEAGASAAMDKLAKSGVSGILVATDGPQSSRIASEARSRRIPVIFLGGSDAADGKASWSFGASQEQSVDLLSSALQSAGLSETIVIDFARPQLTALKGAARFTYSSMQDKEKVVDAVASTLSKRDKTFDSIAIAGPSQYQAELFAALQGRGISLPIFLTRQAQTPQFGKSLAEKGGVVTDMTTVGLPSADMVALESTDQGKSAATFLVALRLLSEDASKVDILGEQRFAAVAGNVKADGHDAVIVLVHAAAEAGSAQADQVRQAMSSVKVDEGDGTALGRYALDSASAAPASALHATTDSPDLRPAHADTIFWFISSK